MFTPRFAVSTLFLFLLIASTAQAQTPALDVADTKGTTLFQVLTNGTLRLPVGAAAGYVLTADASGNAAWQAPTSGGGGLSLPFSGSYNQVQPAFSLTKNGPGELLALSKTGEGQALFITSGGGSVGDFAARINGSFGGITTQAGNGVGVNATNDSASPTIRASNGGSGVAGRFEGDVEVTGGLACPGCIDGADVQDGSLGASDVDATSGFYVSKSQVYVEEVPDTIPSNGIRQVEVSCRDASDLPLDGECDGPSGAAVFLTSFRTVDWANPGAASGYQCVFRSETAGEYNVAARITCLDVN